MAPAEAVAVAAADARPALHAPAPGGTMAGDVKLPEMGDGANGSWRAGGTTEFAVFEVEAEAAAEAEVEEAEAEAEAETSSRGLCLQGAWPPRALPEEKTMPHHLHVWSGNAPPSPTRARCCCDSEGARCGWAVPAAGAA